MKSLVTGGTGFVGGHLVDALRRRGDVITALVRSPSRTAALADQGVRLVVGDLDDHEALARAAAGQDVVYHAAGLVAARNETEFLRANRDGTANLLHAAEAAGARFVLVSSMAAAGPARRGAPLDGSEPAHPVSAYGRSKLAGEAVVRAGAAPWVVVRPPMVYGPRDREVLKVFRLARLGIGAVFGDGRQELTAVPGADLADALVAAGTATAALGKTYYPCHPQIFTSSAFVAAVGRAVGRRVRTVPLPETVGRAVLALTGAAARLRGRATILTADKADEFFQDAWTGDPYPLTRDTGWSAQLDLDAGLADTCRWYRERQWL